MANKNFKQGFLSLFLKSMVITLSIIALIVIGYFTASFFGGGL